jgi:hypothetical protein
VPFTSGGTVAYTSWPWQAQTGTLLYTPAWNAAATGATTTSQTVHVTAPGGMYLCSLPEGNSPGYDAPVTGNVTLNSGYLFDQLGHVLAGQRAVPDRPEVARFRAARVRARDRARELLLSLLTEDQARTYEGDGWFEVAGSDGGLFRIHSAGQAGNVQEILAGRPVASYCCHPPGGLPDADAHVAQMLHLQTDEAGFRRTANRTGLLRRAA